MKLNCDATFDEAGGVTGIGVVLHDHSGKVRLAVLKQIRVFLMSRLARSWLCLSVFDA